MKNYPLLTCALAKGASFFDIKNFYRIYRIFKINKIFIIIIKFLILLIRVI